MSRAQRLVSPSVLAFVVAAGGALLSHVADGAVTTTTALPLGPALPATVETPAHVEASAHVPGILVERKNDSGTPVVIVTPAHAEGSCLASLPTPTVEGAPTDRIYQYVSSGVLTVRLDHLDTSGATPKLEESRVAVDAGTLGAKVLATRTLPLAAVGRGAGGVAAYAGRVPEGLVLLIDGGSRAASFRDSEGRVSSNACVLHRFLLDRHDAASAAAPGSTGAAGQAPDTPRPEGPSAETVHLLTVVEIDKAAVDGPFGKAETPAKDRVLSAAASLSRGSQDAAPVLSVTMGLLRPADRSSPSLGALGFSALR